MSMINTGRQLLFNINDVTMLDINKLIDNGVRFKLENNEGEYEYDKVEEFISDAAIHMYGSKANDNR